MKAASRWSRDRASDAESGKLLDGVGPEGELSAEQLAAIRRIEVRARHLATQLLIGDYRSVFRGTGMEFAEAREYVLGDDVRFIDWNVTARLGAPWVKEYVEERELTLLCAVDLSASQLVARSPMGRLTAAAEVAALLGFAAVYSNDRVGLLTFSDTIERFVPPGKGRRHVLRIVREIVHHAPPAPGTDLAAACDYLSRMLTRRSVVLLISDFFTSGYERALAALARRHEVIAVTLVDPFDLELPPVGIVSVEDAENGDRLLLDTDDPRVRQRYAEAAAARATERHRALGSIGVDEIEVSLDQNVVRPLTTYFRRRALTR